MATIGFSGRDFTIKWDGTIIKGVQSKSATISREQVEITSDDDGGHRALLATPGLISSDWEVSGVTGDEVLIVAILTGAPFTMPTCIATLPTGATIEYSMFLSEISLEGEHDGAYKFSATLMSSGAPTVIPGP